MARPRKYITFEIESIEAKLGYLQHSKQWDKYNAILGFMLFGGYIQNQDNIDRWAAYYKQHMYPCGVCGSNDHIANNCTAE